MHNFLAAVVILANMGFGAWYGLTHHVSPLTGIPVDVSLRGILVNLLIAISLRSRLVNDSAYRCALAVGKRRPLLLRGIAARFTGFGGMHVGAALSAVLWFTRFNDAMLSGGMGYPPVCLVLNACLIVFFMLTVSSALLPVRKRVHELFRVLHRFGIWFVVSLLWIQTEIVLTVRHPGEPWQQRTAAVEFWLLVAMTTLLLLPWVRLRRVPIEVVMSSRDVITVRLKVKRPPPPGAVAMVSLTPLGTCYRFAQIVEPGRKGATLVMSRQQHGWVNDLVDFPQTHLWVHASPRLSSSYLGGLYSSAILVVTGTGIAKAVARMTRGGTVTQLLWVVKEPVRSYGEAFVEKVRCLAPEAVVWDVAARGEPDLVDLTEWLYRRTDVEAVGVLGGGRDGPVVRRAFALRGVPTFGE